MRIVPYGEKISTKQRHPQEAISRSKKSGKNIRSAGSLSFQSSNIPTSENSQNQSFFPETNQYNFRRSLRSGSVGYPTVITPNQLSRSNTTCDASCRKIGLIVGYVGMCIVLLPTVCAIVYFTKDKVVSALSSAKEKICSCFARIKESVSNRSRVAANNSQANDVEIVAT